MTLSARSWAVVDEVVRLNPSEVTPNTLLLLLLLPRLLPLLLMLLVLLCPMPPTMHWKG